MDGSDMSSGEDQIPVIWNFRHDQVVAVAPAGRQIPGWTSLVSSELSKTLAQLSGSARGDSNRVQVRTFAMRDADLPFWDAAAQKGPDGYSYGFVRDPQARFLKNLQFKELAPAQGVPSAPPIDPATIAVAIALHQIQQTLGRMEEQLDGIRDAVEWLEARRKSRQAAELLTALHTLNSVGRRCLASGDVHAEDLLRVAHLEQVVGTVHREILMELRDFASHLAFTDVKSAKMAMFVDQARIADLIQLDKFALDGLMTYQRLLLLSKARDGRLSAGEVTEAKTDLARMAKETKAAAKEIKQVDTDMRDRSTLEYMLTSGIPKGKSDDAKLRDAANKHRAQAQKASSTAKPVVKAFVKSLGDLDHLSLDGRKPLVLVSNNSATDTRPATATSHP